MTGIVVVVVCSIVILTMLGAVLRGSGIKEKLQELIEKVNPLPAAVREEMPKILYKRSDDAPGNYQTVLMNKTRFTIGRGNCNLQLGSSTVENIHAVIRRKEHNGEILYELENCSKVNPIKVYNDSRGCLESMGYRKRIALGERTGLVIGEYKVQIVFE